jgi:hypothetical protein
VSAFGARHLPALSYGSPLRRRTQVFRNLRSLWVGDTLRLKENNRFGGAVVVRCANGAVVRMKRPESVNNC